MKFLPAFSFSDLVTAIFSLVLAGGCAYFAGAKIYSLDSMENPPADLGLFFPPPKKRSAAPQAVLVDPLITSSIDQPETPGTEPFAAVQPYTNDSPVLGYRLLAVVDGAAFVEVTTVKGQHIFPFKRGSLLPGSGPITTIQKINGRWQLATSELTLAAERQ